MLVFITFLVLQNAAVTSANKIQLSPRRHKLNSLHTANFISSRLVRRRGASTTGDIRQETEAAFTSCYFPRVTVSQPSWHIPRGGQQDQFSSTPLQMSPETVAGATTNYFDIGNPFLQYNSIITSINLLGMIISLVFPGMQYHLDLLGTGSFGVASGFMLLYLMSASATAKAPLLSNQLSSIAVIAWSAKLASFLFFRACQVKSDTRLESLLSTPVGTVSFWILSALWGIICSLPHSLGLSALQSSASETAADNIFVIGSGTTIYIIGMIIETLADYQKWNFKRKKPRKFCNVGLWSMSQHPNFFGNILIWSGILIMNLGRLVIFQFGSGDMPPISEEGTGLSYFSDEMVEMASNVLSTLNFCSSLIFASLSIVWDSLFWSGILVMKLAGLDVSPSDFDSSAMSSEDSSILSQFTDSFLDLLSNFLSSALYCLHRLMLASLCPALLYLFFIGQAKGWIGNGVEQSNRKYGKDPKYREYTENVPLIIPNVGKCLRKHVQRNTYVN